MNSINSPTALAHLLMSEGSHSDFPIPGEIPKDKLFALVAKYLPLQDVAGLRTVNRYTRGQVGQLVGPDSLSVWGPALNQLRALPKEQVPNDMQEYFAEDPLKITELDIEKLRNSPRIFLSYVEGNPFLKAGG